MQNESGDLDLNFYFDQSMTPNTDNLSQFYRIISRARELLIDANPELTMPESLTSDQLNDFFKNSAMEQQIINIQNEQAKKTINEFLVKQIAEHKAK